MCGSFYNFVQPLSSKERNRCLLLTALLFCFAAICFIAFPRHTIMLSRIYQRAYRVWNFDYAGLGEKEFVHRFTKERKLLCRRELYSKEFEEMLWSLQDHLDKEGVVLQDYPGSRKTYCVEIAGLPYIVKKSYNASFLESFFYSSRYSRGAWNNAKHAERDGFKTCSPVALVELGSSFSSTSYLLYPRLGKTLEEKREQLKEWREGFTKNLKKQKDLHIIHADFHSRNVLQLEDGSIQYIDIDDLHWYCPLSYVYSVRFNKEMKRFTRDFSSHALLSDLERVTKA